MKVEILSIGNELLWGYTVNTNASFLSRELSQCGYSVFRHTAVPDEPDAIRTALKEAWERSSLVITTGGLGPTIDDRTLASISPLFSSEGEKLPNRVGTALGAFFVEKGRGVVLLPGPPREMESMFLHEALPRIASHFPVKMASFLRKSSLCLLKELEVDPYLREVKKKHPEVEIGIFPGYGTLQVVFQSPTSVDERVAELKEKFPTFFYGDGNIEESVHLELIRRKKTLGLAESMTGGAMAARFTAIPDASRYFLGSLVTYSNSWKERFLHVSRTTLEKKGAVSLAAVKEMVEGLFEDTEADYAIAVSGIAGPSGGSIEKPIGTVYIAIGERGQRIDAGKIQGPLERSSCIELTVQTAIGALWRRLVHNTATFS